VDRESAYEMLKARAEERTKESAPAQPTSGAPQGGGGTLSDVLFGSTGPRGGKREGILEAAAKSAARSAGSQLGRSLLRGVLGSLLGGAAKPKRR